MSFNPGICRTDSCSEYEGTSRNIDTTPVYFSLLSTNFWLSRKQRNNLVKAINGNRHNRGIKLAHWNAGSAHLPNKMCEIEQVISESHPHVLGISEANLKNDHD